MPRMTSAAFFKGSQQRHGLVLKTAGDRDGHLRCTTGTTVVSQQQQTLKLLYHAPNYSSQFLIGYIRVKNPFDGPLKHFGW